MTGYNMLLFVLASTLLVVKSNPTFEDQVLEDVIREVSERNDVPKEVIYDELTQGLGTNDASEIVDEIRSDEIPEPETQDPSFFGGMWNAIKHVAHGIGSAVHGVARGIGHVARKIVKGAKHVFGDESQDSPVVHVDVGFHTGDGTGGSETKIGHTNTAYECLQQCYVRQITDPRINGVTFGKYVGSRARECYCERNMNGRNSNTNWESSYLMALPRSVKFLTGDGKGGSEFKIGYANTAIECLVKCQVRQSTNPRINGATFGKLGGSRAKECYCEINMNGRNSNYQWESSFLPAVHRYVGFVTGDGKGGSETYIGHTNTANECLQQCFAKKTSDARINGATFGKLGGSRAKECYCEMNMSGRNSNYKWESSYLPDGNVNVVYHDAADPKKNKGEKNVDKDNKDDKKDDKHEEKEGKDEIKH